MRLVVVTQQVEPASPVLGAWMEALQEPGLEILP